MPLLMCPNDNAAMQTVHRGGVEFDMCPTCRGVWLDRGELEKLMALGGSGDDRPSTPPPQAYPPHGQPWGNQPPQPDPRYERRYDNDDKRYDRHGYAPKKKKGFDMFDIFD